MNDAALAISILALVAAVVAAFSGWRSAGASAQSARVALAADRRARRPRLRIEFLSPAQAPGDRVIYRVFNDGPQDLDRIVVHRPRPPDGIIYGVVTTEVGRDFGDEAPHEALPIGGHFRFTLCCGAAEHLPVFQCRVECRAEEDAWTEFLTLENPRQEKAPSIH